MFIKFIEKNERRVYRVLEIVIGSLTWLVLLSPFWLGFLAPKAIVFLLTFLAIFWVYLAVRHSAGMVVGYNRYRHELKMDWWEQCKLLNVSSLPEKETRPASLTEVKHFILIPVVNEPYEVLKPSIDSLVNQTFPTNQITLIYTLEEKCQEKELPVIMDALEGREKLFENFLVYVHPANIPGEAIGVAGANRTWGAEHAVQDLEKLGKNLRNYIFTTMDSDHVLHPQFISRLTHLYLTSDRRDYKFYSSAVDLFDNNYWEVPTVMRIEATSTLMGGLSDWVVTHTGLKESFSNYSASLNTLIDAKYWDVQVGVDDTIFFWRAFFARNGDFVGIPHYIPYSADAVKGTSYLNSYRSLYKQLVRWGWGVVAAPMSIKEFLKNTKVPLKAKFVWTLEHLKKKVLLLNVVFLITFGFAILTAVNPFIKQTSYAYTLPNIMSAILTIPLIFFIPATIIKFKLVKPMPEDWPMWRKALAVLEGPLVLVNLLTFSFFPSLEAQTRMILGKRMKDLYHTPKIRELKA